MFTSDMEFLRCDLCFKYLHKDIFCDHRRQCKGLDSTELKPKEVRSKLDSINEKDLTRHGLKGANALSAVERKKRAECEAQLLKQHMCEMEAEEAARRKNSTKDVNDLLAELDGDRFGEKGWQK
eukprot:PhM_4_TR17966/c0_g1_i1/m.76689